MTLLSGIAVLTVWRGSPHDHEGLGGGGASPSGSAPCLGYAGETILAPFRAVAGFFDRLFSQFSKVDFAVLMGMQFLAQMGQGVVQGTIAKSLAFGGEQGFDVQNLPSARYLLTVVLFLYLPVHLHLAVRRRVHRPLPASARRVGGVADHGGDRDRRGVRDPRAARRRHHRGQGRLDGRA